MQKTAFPANGAQSERCGSLQLAGTISDQGDSDNLGSGVVAARFPWLSHVLDTRKLEWAIGWAPRRAFRLVLWVPKSLGNVPSADSSDLFSGESVLGAVEANGQRSFDALAKR